MMSKNLYVSVAALILSPCLSKSTALKYFSGPLELGHVFISDFFVTCALMVQCRWQGRRFAVGTIFGGASFLAIAAALAPYTGGPAHIHSLPLFCGRGCHLILQLPVLLH